MAGKSTAQVCKDLGAPYWRVYDLIRRGLLPEPARVGGTGAYAWMPEDVERARVALLAMRHGRRPEARPA